jgi:hypothetical protein
MQSICARWPETIAECKEKICLYGHRHQELVHEQYGIRFMMVGSPAKPCKWSADSSFIGNRRYFEAITLDAVEGQVGTTRVNLRDVKPIVVDGEKPIKVKRTRTRRAKKIATLKSQFND